MGIPAEEFFGTEAAPKKVSAQEFSGGGPVEVFKPEEPSILERAAEVPKQFALGFEDVVNLIARPLESAVGNIVITPDGLEFLSPDEIGKLRDEGIETRLLPESIEQTEPASLAGKGARIAGQTVAAGPILGRVAGFIPKPVPAITKLGRLKQFPQKIVAEAGKTFARAPVKTTLIEGGLGFTAGGGGFVAKKTFPDSDAAVFIGEIIGGTAPALMPLRIAVKAGGGIRSIIKKISSPFTSLGGRKRAAARAQRAGTPEQRAEALKELDQPTTLDPETGQPLLTPAQRTGEPGLLALERAVMESSEELKRLGDVNIAHANDAIQKSLVRLGGEDISTATIVIRDAQDYLSGLLDTRVRIAAQRTDERIAELGPKADREQLNRIASEEINNALVAARKQEKELFDAVPVETAVPFSKSKAKFDVFVRDLGKAQQEDIPSIARKFLGKRSKDFFGKKPPKGFKSNETSIKELRALQSKLRQVARDARSVQHNNLNKARIADGIANSINDDLADVRAGQGVADQVSLAIEFSRGLNERFNSGTVAKILGRKSTGADLVPAGLTLEESIGVTGPKAREAIDDLIKIFDSPEAPGSEMLIDASEDFLRTKFLKSAVDRGQLNVRAARRFLAQNEEILKRLPRVRNQIDEVIESGETMAVTQRQRAKVALDDPKVSKATMLIEKGPVETFRQISKLKPEEAAKEMQKLINIVARDETEDALNGLKSGFIEFLYATSKEKARDTQGVQFLSGFALRDVLKSSESSAKRLFSKEELKRIDIITNDLIKLEKRRAAKLTPEGVISDKPSKIVEMLAGITGAAFGRAQAQRLGIGGTIQIPGIMASRFRSLVAAGVRDPAGRLLRDMITDETLFRELLQSNLEEGGTALTKEATTRLNSWVAVVLAEYGGAFDEQQQLDNSLEGF